VVTLLQPIVTAGMQLAPDVAFPFPLVLPDETFTVAAAAASVSR